MAYGLFGRAGYAHSVDSGFRSRSEAARKELRPRESVDDRLRVELPDVDAVREFFDLRKQRREVAGSLVGGQHFAVLPQFNDQQLLGIGRMQVVLIRDISVFLLRGFGQLFEQSQRLRAVLLRDGDGYQNVDHML